MSFDYCVVNRRKFLFAGGTALVGLTVQSTFGAVLGQKVKSGTTVNVPGVSVLGGAKKPVYVPAADDPVAYSAADNLFWLDQEHEHAKLLIMHMPSPDLDAQRIQVKQFEPLFAAQLEKARGINRSNYVAFNRSTTDLVKRFLDTKENLRAAQDAGQLKSLAWPTFFEHVIREGEYFTKRLNNYSKGDIDLNRSEVVDFWTEIMGEHADFIAHMLDPKERALVEKAMKTSEKWRDLNAGKVAGSMEEETRKAAEDFVSFKKVAQKGIENGTIDSIIHPILADHVLREALKFTDELKRSRLT